MTEKRDGSRDVAVWDSIDCESHIMRACQWEPGMDAHAHHVPITELESVTRERDETARELLRLTHQMQEIHYALGALSSSLGNGMGDESTTFGELVERISTGVDRHLCVAQDRINAAVRRVGELESMLVPHPGETWDSDKPPMADRVYDLFVTLSRLGTQDETEPFRGTLRILLCNRDTLASRARELETAVRWVIASFPEDANLVTQLESLLANESSDA